MVAEPIFFQPNRVWWCYLGGVLLDEFTGRGPGKDDYFPEDWLASVTRAVNGERSQGPDEGLSRSAGGKLLLDMLQPAFPDVTAGLGEAIVLSTYGADIRYPGDQPEPGADESRQAVELARNVRDAVLPLLPPIDR